MAVDLGDAVLNLTTDPSSAIKGLSKVREDLDKTGHRFVTMGAIATGAFLGVGAGLFKLGKDFDKAYDIIRKKTGETGAEFDSLKSSFREVLKQVPNSMDEVATTMSTLNTLLGLTGKELEAFTKQTLMYAKVNDEDAGKSAETLGRLINGLNIPVEDGVKLMDKLTLAGQKTGIGVNQLAEYMIKAGPAFEEMGYNTDRQIALFSQFFKYGADPAEILSSLNIAMTRMAKSGAKDAREAFEMIIQEVKDAPDILSATEKAADAFGARVGGKVADDIRNGRFDIEEWVAELELAGDVVKDTYKETQSFGESFAILRNKARVYLEPVASTIFNVASIGMDAFNKFFETHSDSFRRFWEFHVRPPLNQLSEFMTGTVIPIFEKFGNFIKNEIVPPVSELGSAIGDKLIPPLRTAFEWLNKHGVLGPVVAGIIGTLLVAAVVSLTVAAWGLAVAVIAATWPFIAIAAAVGALIGVIYLLAKNWEAVTATVPGLGTAIEGVWKIMRGFWNWLSGTAMPFIRRIPSDIKSEWDAIVRFTKNSWDSVTRIVTGAKNAIFDAIKWPFEEGYKAIGNILRSIRAEVRSLLQSAVNIAYGFANKFAEAVDWIADKIGISWRIGTIAVPQIPLFAKGGTMRQSGLAVVGEQGPELASFQSGTRITSNRDTVAMLKGLIGEAGIGFGPPSWGDVKGAVSGLGNLAKKGVREFIALGAEPIVKRAMKMFGVEAFSGAARFMTEFGKGIFDKIVSGLVDVVKNWIRGADEATAMGTGILGRPLQSYVLTQRFGMTPFASSGLYGGAGHPGVDLAAPTGTPIYAADTGRVNLAGWAGGLGNAVSIMHNGLRTVYGHMDSIATTINAVVQKGELIGRVGNTGFSFGPHLHFEVYEGGRLADPMRFVALANGVRNFKGGLALLGDGGGPEIVSLPRGTDVYSNAETNRILENGGGDTYVTVYLDSEPIAARIEKRQSKQMRLASRGV